jgi:hypothetical protein
MIDGSVIFLFIDTCYSSQIKTKLQINAINTLISKEYKFLIKWKYSLYRTFCTSIIFYDVENNDENIVPVDTIQIWYKIILL